MRVSYLTITLLAVVCLGIAAEGRSQDVPQTVQPQSPAVAPTVIALSGQLRTPVGDARTGTVRLVISLYARKDDPVPLWIENQVITLDQAGRYVVNFGSTREDGLPTDLFAANTARWVGVAVEGESEQPRMILPSVPYAAKATVADTLSGKTATDFVLTENLSERVAKVMETAKGRSRGLADPVEPLSPTTTNALAKFTDTAGTVGDSVVIESSGNIGVGTASPEEKLHIMGSVAVRGGDKIGFTNTASPNFRGWLVPYNASDGFFEVFSSFNNGGFRVHTGNSLTERFRIDASGNVGVGIATSEEKLHVAGNIAVRGGDRIGFTNAASPNFRGWLVPYNASDGFFEVFSSYSGGGFRIHTGNSLVERFRIDAGGNVSIGGSTSPAEKFQVAGLINFKEPTYHSIYIGKNAGGPGWPSLGVGNTVLGYNAMASPTAAGVGDNTAIGGRAMQALTTGGYNTAIGADTMLHVSSGAQNTALGKTALFNLQTGDYNVALGKNALFTTGAGHNNVAVGGDSLYSLGTTVNPPCMPPCGAYNTALGHAAGFSLKDGYGNILIGNYAGTSLTNGSFNIVIGSNIELPNVNAGNMVNIGNLIYANNLKVGSSGTGTVLSTGSVGIGTNTFATGQRLEVNGGIALNPQTAQPACDAAVRGTFWFTKSGAGVADKVEVCAKNEVEEYAWRVLWVP